MMSRGLRCFPGKSRLPRETTDFLRIELPSQGQPCKACGQAAFQLADRTGAPYYAGLEYTAQTHGNGFTYDLLDKANPNPSYSKL